MHSRHVTCSVHGAALIVPLKDFVKVGLFLSLLFLAFCNNVFTEAHELMRFLTLWSRRIYDMFETHLDGVSSS